MVAMLLPGGRSWMSGSVGLGEWPIGAGSGAEELGCPGGANGTPGVGAAVGSDVAAVGGGGGPALAPRLDVTLDGRRLAGPALAGATLGGGTLAGPELSLAAAEPGEKPFGSGGAGIAGGNGASGLRGAMPEMPRPAFGRLDAGAGDDDGGAADDGGGPDIGTWGASGATGDDGV